jgi:signal transduction histidine kinase
VEDLRPTLLDTIGLFAALSWQFRRGCKRAGLKYTEAYPELNPQLNAKVLIALFRIAQEAFDLILQHDELTALDLRVQTTDSTFSLQLTDNGKAARGESSGGIASSIAHRIRHFGGRLDFARREHGTTLRVSLPLTPANCLATAEGAFP